MNSQLSLFDVGFVKRIVIGNTNPEKTVDEQMIERQMAALNKCLHDYPKGRIIGTERNFYILNINEHQIVMQYTVYHIGFKRKPDWL